MSFINKILLISETLSTVAIGLIGPIYAIYVEGIGGDILDAASAYSAFMITMGLVIYFLGKFEDYLKHDKWFIVGGYLASAVGFVLYIFVSSTLELLIVQLILGFGFAIRVPAYDSLYTKSVVHKHFALAWGDWEAADSLATGIAALVGGLIANYYGFKTLLSVMFLIALVSFLSSLMLFSRRTEVKL